MTKYKATVVAIDPKNEQHYRAYYDNLNNCSKPPVYLIHDIEFESDEIESLEECNLVYNICKIITPIVQKKLNKRFEQLISLYNRDNKEVIYGSNRDNTST